MERVQIRPETRVAEILSGLPPAARFFLDRRLGCVGCRMAPFCTLEEVCRQYELDSRQFLSDLRTLEDSNGSY